MRPSDVCGIGLRADDDEVVPRNLPTVDAVAVVDEVLFGLGVMNKHEIGIATTRGIEGLTCTEREDPNLNPRRLGENGQDSRQQAGIIN